MTENAGVFPKPEPSLAVITDDANVFAVILAKPEYPGRTGDLKNARLDLEAKLKVLGQYVNNVAKGDEAILEKSGFPLSKVPSPHGDIPATTEAGVELDADGHFDIWATPPEADYYGVIFAATVADNPDDDPSHWVFQYCATPEVTFTNGIVSGKKYKFAVAFVGSSEMLHWFHIGKMMFARIQLGPTFFSSFKKEGILFNALALSGVLLGAFLAVVIRFIFNLNIENTVGMMSGAVTNTPGLGAAISVLSEIKTEFSDRTFGDPTVAYAISYPFGVIGLITMVIIIKLLFKIDIDKEKQIYHTQKTGDINPLIRKKCRVTEARFVGKTLSIILEEFEKQQLVISRIKHHGEKDVRVPNMDTIIQERDVLMVIGVERDVDFFISFVGRVSTDLFIESEQDMMSKNIYVTKSNATHKTLKQLDLLNKFDLKVTRVIRGGRELLASPSLELFYGDKIRIVGTKESVREAEDILGNSEKKMLEPDFVSIFGGLLLGILFGSVPFVLPTMPIPIKLGFAAGPLIVALIISRFGGVSFIHSYVNDGAINFMKDFGISLFFAAVGIHAGEAFYDNFIKFNGWTLLILGLIVTIVPIIFMAICTKLLKINFLQFSGILSGTYTDPAALTFCTAYLNSDIPLQAYSIVYPLVTICRIFLAQLLILLLVTH
ncbi:hypothetical protein CHS0354_000448 [Potamilus streckersoni]|uniref:RCK C-terminal domain-containing protein n=1 Tax=Potamilus streckersoni TaxID=2493646 RepID=A0AAE0T6L1_9BIVA|nr:hypothetical protein CHS0354_000448 [Potamilus streckersoni]